MHFLFEAVLVGLAFLPIFYVVERFGFSKWVTLFLAGALFHVVAEVTGVNRAYALMKA
jgi:hypothetical protein